MYDYIRHHTVARTASTVCPILLITFVINFILTFAYAPRCMRKMYEQRQHRRMLQPNELNRANSVLHTWQCVDACVLNNLSTYSLFNAPTHRTTNITIDTASPRHTQFDDHDESTVTVSIYNIATRSVHVMTDAAATTPSSYTQQQQMYFEPSHTHFVGEQVDAFHSSKRWMQTTVKRVSDTRIHVQYALTRNTEGVARGSPLIAPLHAYTASPPASSSSAAVSLCSLILMYAGSTYVRGSGGDEWRMVQWEPDRVKAMEDAVRRDKLERSSRQHTCCCRVRTRMHR